LRARIKAINGRELSFQSRDHSREHQRLGHEYLLTYRAGLDPNETVVEGKLWPPTPSSEPEVSLDENMKGLMGIGLGSTIVFDMQGRDVTARVTSFRSIDIKNSRTAFAVLFRPGVLESAPQMMVAAVNGPADDTVRARFQRSLVDKYPNVTVIDVAELVKVIEKVLDNITLAVSFIGAFVFLSGALILIGSIAMTKFQRVYEIALLKTLGAKRRSLIGMMLAEYGLMGLVAGIIGSATGVGLSYAIAKLILEIPWKFASGIGIVGIVGTLLLVTVVGAAASFDALTHRPLSILRS
ncbi:MAG: ABC transporter permease, partial [Blastocatellia bacterium]